jgi:hypothetical protein
MGTVKTKYQWDSATAPQPNQVNPQITADFLKEDLNQNNP